jgi:hypothetical protein
MRFGLLTLLIVLALGPPAMAGSYWAGGYLALAELARAQQPKTFCPAVVGEPPDFENTGLDWIPLGTNAID